MDYAATYQEVRGCRFSIDHDLVQIRVVASPDALTAYNGRTAPFPTGSIVIKEQFPGRDTTCSGPIFSITVMQKLAVGSSPETLDWSWQEVTGAGLRAVNNDPALCVQCHNDCGKPPDGYDGTCTLP